MLRSRYLTLLATSALTAFTWLDANAQQIILDGRTDTHLNAVDATTTAVTTTTISGGNAINAFRRFGVDAGNTVNLVQPSGTHSLINIVTGGEASNISGILNAYQDGRIGGNSVIANTNGIVISKDGVVNAGRLTLTTPSQEFTDRFFQPNGSVNTAALDTLAIGDETLNSIADISVHGRIDAEAVAIRAGRDIKVDGVIHSRFGSMSYAVDKPDSAGKKSAKVQAATGLSVSSNGVVTLFAGRDINVRGKISAKRSQASPTPATQTVSGGEVYLYASRNLTLEQQALIDVSGVGTGNAGTALVFGKQDATLSNGALIDASTKAGTGGYIEFSASHDVNLSGTLSASSQSGAAGTIFIDPENLTISTNQNSAGANLIYVADKTLTVSGGVTINTDGGNLTMAVGKNIVVDGANLTDGIAQSATAAIRRDVNGKVVLDKFGTSITLGTGVVISTRDLAAGSTDFANGVSQGKSGSVTLFAPDIKLEDGAKIYAQGTSSHAGGTVLLEAKSNEVQGFGIGTSDFGKTSITLTNATIKAGAINLLSEAYATNLDARRDPAVGSGIGGGLGGSGTVPDFPQLPEFPSLPDFPNLADLFIDYFTIEARSDINITGSSLDASLSTNIDSKAITDVEDTSNTYIVLGFNMGISKTHSAINIASSDITSKQDIDVHSAAQEYQRLESRLLAVDVAPTIAVTISDRDLENQVLIDPASKLIADQNIKVWAETTKNLALTNKIHTGVGGQVEASFIYTNGDNLTEVVIGGELEAKGNIEIKASTTYDQYAATSSVGGLLDNKLAKIGAVTKARAAGNSILTEIGSTLFNKDLSGSLSGGKAVAVSIVVSDENDNTFARVGTTYQALGTGLTTPFAAAGTPKLTARGRISVDAMQLHGVDRGTGGVLAQGQPIRIRAASNIGSDLAASDAIVLGAAFSNFTGKTVAEIGPNAELATTHFGDINVNASAKTLAFNFGEIDVGKELEDFFKGIDGDASADSELVSGSKAVANLHIPKFPFNPLNVFTVESGATSEAAGIGIALNGHLFDMNNEVTAVVRSGAKLSAFGEVKVTAYNYQQSVNIANLPDPTTFVLGAGAGNGVGGSSNTVIRHSTVKALVENGADLSGSHITVRAKNDGTNLSSATSFGKATSTAVNGAINIAVIENETIAQIGETTKIATGSLTVEAKDDLTLWTVASGIGFGSGAGVGIANADSVIERSTQALIGNRDLMAATLGNASTTYITADAVNIKSENTGYALAVSVAGGRATGGYSGAASVGVQQFKKVEAIAGIHAKGKMAIGAGGLTVSAKNNTTAVTVTPAVSSSTSGSLAGAASTFVADGYDTLAFVKDTTVSSGGDIRITADQDSDIHLVAIGGSVSAGSAATGSTTVNTIKGTVAADVKNASLITTGASKVVITSTDISHDNAVSGAITSSSGSALGGSVAYNTLAITQRAGAENSVLDASSVEILTKAEARIRAIAASATIGSSFTGNGAVTFNDIGNSYRSYLTGGTISARSGDISVLAKKASKIESLAGGISGSGSGSFGGAVAVNFIHDQTLADVLVTGKINTAGDFVIDADNSATVKTLAVAGGASSGSALSASVAYTQIGSATGGDSDIADGDYGDEQRDAVIALATSENKEGADLSSGIEKTSAVLTANWNASVDPEITAKSVAVTATDTSIIKSLTGSVAGASTAGIGAALSLNSLHGSTNAIVAANGAVRFTTTGAVAASGLTVNAKNEATISTLAGALGAGGTVGGAGSATVNILNGSSYAGIVGLATAPVANTLTVVGGNVVLAATQSGTIEALAGAVGAGGTAGIAGAVSVNLLSSDAVAEISKLALDVDDGPATARTIDVDASLTSDVNTIGASAGFAGTGAFAGSVAVNRLDGLVLAKLAGASLVAKGAITFDAKNDTDFDAITAGGAAAGAAAVGASVSINRIGGTTEASSLNSNLTGSSVSFDAYSDADMNTIGGAGALGGKASFNAAVSENILTARVTASAIGGSINSAGDINFSSQNIGSNNAHLISVSLGGAVSAGASVAFAHNNAILFAGMNGTDVTAADKISVIAKDVSTIDAEGLAVSASFGQGASGVVITAKNTAQVNAQLGGASNITATGDVIVQATTDSTLTTEQAAVAVGYIGVGAVVARSENGTNVQAHLGATSVNAAGVSVVAKDEADIDATGYAVAGGTIGASAADIIAKNGSTTVAGIAAGSRVNTSSALNVKSSSISTVNADTTQVVVGAVTVGLSWATAISNTNVTTQIGDGASLIANGAVAIEANATSTIGAGAFSVAGGVAGVGGASAEALNDYLVNTMIGDAAVKSRPSNVVIGANAITTARANATGVSFGLVAGGATDAFAGQQGGNTVAQTTVSGGANLQAAGTLSLGGTANKTQSADVTSGGGAAGSFRSGEASTRARSQTGVVLLDSLAANKTTALSGRMTIDSALDVSHTAKVNNVNASLIGYSGGRAGNDTAGTSQVIIGNNAQMAAGYVYIKAKNDVQQVSVGNNVLSHSGGAFDGAAADATTTIINTTSINIKDGVALEQFGSASNPGTLDLGIENKIYGRLATSLDSGGAIAIANSTTTFNATQNNSVEIGNAKLFSNGTVRLYNRSDADISANTSTTTYGLSGSANAGSNATFTSIDTITLKSGADVEGVEGVSISVGNSPSGDAAISVATDTRLYNRTFIPIGSDPVANSTVNATRRIDIQQGAIVQSAKDISLYANKASNSLSAIGVGKDLWKEIFNELFGGILDLFFDVDLSLELRHGVSADNSTSNLNIDGTVLAGNRSKKYLLIDALGNVTGQGTNPNTVATNQGISFTRRDSVSILAEAQARVDQLKRDIAIIKATNAGGARDAELAAAESEFDFRGTRLDALKVASPPPTSTYLDIDHIRVDEGDIIISAVNVTGGTSGRLQANGDALVKIEVAANQTLNIGDIIFGSKEGGRISINNVGVTSAGNINALSGANVGAGFTVAATPSGGGSELVINSSFSGTSDYGPDIILNGEIDNSRGGVSLRTERGTIDSRGTIRALSFTAIAPNGSFIQTYQPGVDSKLGYPELSYADIVDQENLDRAAASVPLKLNAVGVLVPITLGAASVFDLYMYDSAGNLVYNPDGSLKIDNVRLLNRNYFSDVDLEALGARPNTGKGIEVGQDVYIASEYINISGKISSGSGLYDVDISNSLTQSVLDSYFATSIVPSTGREVIYSTNPAFTNISGVSGNAIVFFDHDQKRLVADPMLTRPGRITLFGDIISTGNGQLTVFDGFGQVAVNNASDFDLQFDAISTGAGPDGVAGMITITDTSKPTVNITADAPRGEFLKTVYRYENGVTRITNNDATNGGAAIDTAASNIYAYNPTADRHYVYQTKRTVTLDATYVVREYDGSFGGAVSTDKILSNRAKYTVTPFVSTGKVVVKSGVNPEEYQAFSNGFGLSTRDRQTGGANPTTIKVLLTDAGYTRTEGGLETEVLLGGTLGGLQYRDVVFTGTRTASQILDHQFEADKPIETRFVGGTAPGVNITSTGKGRVLFGESVINSGQTNISAQASVLTTSGMVTVGSGSATISALGSISGEGTGSFNVAMTDGATLSATARDNINIRQFASTANVDGNLNIAKVHYTGDLGQQANKTFGNVSIHAAGDITGVGGEPAQVKGINVSLISEDGAINGSIEPLRIATGQGVDARFNASAANDIRLKQTSGNLKVDLIESRTGDVLIDVAAGQVLDANIRETADTRTVAELTQSWKDLGLLDDGSGNVAARLVSVRNAQYAEYWNKRRSSPAPQIFALTTQERANFYTTAERAALVTQGLNEAQIDSRIDAHITEMQGLYDIWNAQAAHDDSYSYTLRGTELVDSRAEWQLNQLQYGIPNSLDANRTDTTTAIEEPNIKAAGTITVVRSGGVGTFKSDLEIGAGAKLFDSTRRAGETQAQADARVQEAYLALLTAEEGDVRRVGDILYIRRADDLDVTAAGAVTMTSGKYVGTNGDIFLGSELDLKLARLNADGDVRVTTSGNILDVAPDTNGTVNALGTILLEAARGSIGISTRALTVNTAKRVTARAGTDIFLASNGDLNTGRINAANHVELTSRFGGIFDGFADTKANLRGVSFQLNAATDIGTAGNALELLQDPGTGMLRLGAKNAFVESESDLSVERLDVGTGTAELSLQNGSLGFAPKNGEAGLSAGTARITVPGLVTDDETGTLAIQADTLELKAGGVGAVSTAGVENRLNIDVNTANLAASGPGAVFRIQEADNATFGSSAADLIRDIYLGAGNDLTFGLLAASDLIRLDQIGGDIRSGEIQAADVSIDVAGGIGSGAPVEITASLLDIKTAGVGTVGDTKLILRGPSAGIEFIDLSGAGAMLDLKAPATNVTLLAGLPGISTQGGRILIDANQNLTSNASIGSHGGDMKLEVGHDLKTNATILSGGGDLMIDVGRDLTSNGDIGSSGGEMTIDVGRDLNIHANLLSGGGNVMIDVGQDLTSNGNIGSSGGDVRIDVGFSGLGHFVQADGTSVNSGAGHLAVNTTGDFALASLRSDKAAGEAIALNVGGALTDSGDADRDLIAKASDLAVVNLTAGSMPIPGPGGLETDIRRLNANVLTGDLHINNAGDLRLETVSSQAGLVDVFADGNLHVGNVSSENAVDPAASRIVLAARGSVLADKAKLDASQIALVSIGASIGAGASKPFTADTKSGAGLTLVADKNISYRETSGDVRIENILADKGDISLSLNGASGSVQNMGAGNDINLKDINNLTIARMGGDTVINILDNPVLALVNQPLYGQRIIRSPEDVRIEAMGAVKIVDATIGGSFELRANIIDLGLTDPSPENGLSLILSGPGGNLAERIDVRVKTAGALNIKELRVVTGDIATSGPELTLSNATISENVWFRQAGTDLYVTNKKTYTGLSDVADIQAITDDNGSVTFSLRNEFELDYEPHILHHRQALLLTSATGNFSITASEIVSDRNNTNMVAGRSFKIAVLDAGGAVIGDFIVRLPASSTGQIELEDFINTEKFRAYVKESLGEAATLQITGDASGNQEISLIAK
ncbi:MAG: leukotoxin LktA family filamentous adhesin [Hoeflea sp.]|uniref:leukotoxin LktA family filamentous adhesin n=1 Tax=Hoeflea sp. TaxID=1940281 RepID=UPI003EF57AEF